jgi:NOL1/NOP2/fmu family ribosome biogenesis protein
MADQSNNDPHRFERLPATAADRDIEGRPTRKAVLQFWAQNYGVAPETFDRHTFWEKGAGKVWAFTSEPPSPVGVEAIGMTFLRTRQEHWKPTTDGVQRFGRYARANVLVLDRDEATQFLNGETQELPRWDGDWGYVIVSHQIAGDTEPIGVGLYLYGELRSQIPKGRQRDL